MQTLGQAVCVQFPRIIAPCMRRVLCFIGSLGPSSRGPDPPKAGFERRLPLLMVCDISMDKFMPGGVSWKHPLMQCLKAREGFRGQFICTYGPLCRREAGTRSGVGGTHTLSKIILPQGARCLLLDDLTGGQFRECFRLGVTAPGKRGTVSSN